MHCHATVNVVEPDLSAVLFASGEHHRCASGCKTSVGTKASLSNEPSEILWRGGNGAGGNEATWTKVAAATELSGESESIEPAIRRRSPRRTRFRLQPNRYKVSTNPDYCDRVTNSAELFARAQKRIPSGVNSPVRAFRNVNDVVFTRASTRV